MDRHVHVQHSPRRMERTKDTDKNRLKIIFGFAEKL